MRIEAYNQVQQVYSPKKAPQAASAQRAYRTDDVQISSIGKDILTAKNAVKASPDVREDVVAPIREQVQKGTYDVSADDFAGKLMEKFNQAV